MLPRLVSLVPLVQLELGQDLKLLLLDLLLVQRLEGRLRREELANKREGGEQKWEEGD